MSKLQIYFRSIPHSPEVKYYIDRYFEKLNRIYPKIQTCKIKVDITKKHTHKIKSFTISIDITLPGKELVTRKRNNNLYIAVREAFYAAEKLLDKYGKRNQSYYDKFSFYTKNNNQSNPIEIGFNHNNLI